MEKREPAYTVRGDALDLSQKAENDCSWECKLVQPLWKTVRRFLKKLEIELTYDPSIPLLGIHTEETRSERHMCTPVFIAALFIIARIGSNLDAHQQTNG